MILLLLPKNAYNSDTPKIGRRGSPDEPGASPGEVGQETGKGCHRSLLLKNVDGVITPAKPWRMEMPPENEEANGQTAS